MILHLVLFTPRPDLRPDERGALASALERAIRTIPSVRDCRVGRRVRIGAAYEAVEPQDFEYCGLIEFDDRAGLEAYLAHPAHAELGRLFYETNARTFVHDFELIPGTDASTLTV